MDQSFSALTYGVAALVVCVCFAGVYQTLSNFMKSSYTASDLWEAWNGSFWDRVERWRIPSIENPIRRYSAWCICSVLATIQILLIAPVILTGALVSHVNGRRSKKVEAE